MVENYYKNNFEEIYLEYPNINSVRDLLLGLFSYEDEGLHNVKTYYDEACIEEQCEAGKYRSFGDVYNIVNTYFPNTSCKDILKELVYLYDGSHYLWTIHCNDIDKPTMYYAESINMYEDTLYPKYTEAHNENYSWGDLYRLLGVNNVEELRKWYDENKEV